MSAGLQKPYHCSIPKPSTVYVAIDRIGWGSYTLLMISVIWRKRAIPVAWMWLDKLGSTNHDEQTTVLSSALSYLSDYTEVHHSATHPP